MGGPSSKGELKNILEKSGADCIVRGEGEIVTWNLLASDFALADVVLILPWSTRAVASDLYKALLKCLSLPSFLFLPRRIFHFPFSAPSLKL